VNLCDGLPRATTDNQARRTAADNRKRVPDDRSSCGHGRAFLASVGVRPPEKREGLEPRVGLVVGGDCGGEHSSSSWTDSKPADCSTANQTPTTAATTSSPSPTQAGRCSPTAAETSARWRPAFSAHSAPQTGTRSPVRCPASTIPRKPPDAFPTAPQRFKRLSDELDQ
jgi:hypothetical protein